MSVSSAAAGRVELDARASRPPRSPRLTPALPSFPDPTSSSVRSFLPQMATVLSAPPSPIHTPTGSSPLLGASSFSHLVPETAGSPSRPLPAHRSLSQSRRSSQNASPPPNSLLLSSSTYEPQPSPTSSTSSLASSIERGRTSPNGLLGVAWGARRGSDTHLNELAVDHDLQTGRRSRSVSPRLGGSLTLGQGEPMATSPTPSPSPRISGRGSSFEDNGDLRRPVKAWTLGQRSESCDSSGTEVGPSVSFFLRHPNGRWLFRPSRALRSPAPLAASFLSSRPS